MGSKELVNFYDQLGKVLTELINETYGRKMGFALLVFPFGEDIREGKGGDYVSNAQRKQMVKALRETADRLESKAYIGRPIGEA